MTADNERCYIFYEVNTRLEPSAVNTDMTEMVGHVAERERKDEREKGGERRG